ncbi:MAG TPA: helix-turn-helix domain-containing protein [Pseudonocardiaceae bacterium]
MPSPTLRERKRNRTRQALLDAAVELFERKGYDGTTVADIAEAADIGTRTFFGYFGSKEELLFPDSARRVDAAVDAIANRAPDDRPVDVLLRALRDVAAPAGQPDDMIDRLARLRLRLIRTVPAVRGRALQVQLDAQRAIATHLGQAYPDELDELTAAALVGAFVGAINGALLALLDSDDDDADPEHVRQRLQRATDVALRPWR